MANYKFIINPVPLNRRKRRFIDTLAKRMAEKKLRFSVEYTTKDRNAEIIARESAMQGYDIIVACGGDGTINEVINGIYGTKAGLAIIPLGTSNDFAKHLNITTLHKSEVTLFNGKRKKIDLGEAELISNGEKRKILFCSTSGIGFDGRLLKLNHSKLFLQMKRFLKNISYPLFGFFLVFFYKSNDVEIRFSEKIIKTRLFMLNANFVRSMAGMRVTPNAGLNNNSFDIFMVEDTGILKKIAGLVWYGFTSKKINFREVQYISLDGMSSNRFNLSNIDEFTVTSEKPVDVQLNGDFLGYTPANFRLIKNAIEILI